MLWPSYVTYDVYWHYSPDTENILLYSFESVLRCATLISFFIVILRMKQCFDCCSIKRLQKKKKKKEEEKFLTGIFLISIIETETKVQISDYLGRHNWQTKEMFFVTRIKNTVKSFSPFVRILFEQTRNGNPIEKSFFSSKSKMGNPNISFIFKWRKEQILWKCTNNLDKTV